MRQTHYQSYIPKKMNKEVANYNSRQLRKVSNLKTVLIGLPASGKTTFVESLITVSPINYISLGAITRAELQRDTELSAKLKQLFQDSSPWPGEFAMSVLEPHILSTRGNGFVLDGVPKKLSEVKVMVSRFRKLGIKLDAVIALEVSNDRAMERIDTRDNSGRMERVSHYETRFDVWKRDREATLGELLGLTSNIKTIDTDKLPVEGVFAEGLDFLLSCVNKGL